MAGIDELGRAAITEMEERGTRVSVFSVDVSDRKRVDAVIKEVQVYILKHIARRSGKNRENAI